MTVGRLNRLSYKALVSLVWLAGCYFVVRLMLLGIYRPELFDIGRGFVIVVGLVMAGGICIYSFFGGGHPGHVLRAINVALFAVLAYLMFSDYAYNTDVDLLVSARTWACSIAIVLLNANWGRSLKAEYRAHGPVNYFDVYFGT